MSMEDPSNQEGFGEKPEVCGCCSYMWPSGTPHPAHLAPSSALQRLFHVPSGGRDWYDVGLKGRSALACDFSAPVGTALQGCSKPRPRPHPTTSASRSQSLGCICLPVPARW